MRYSYISPNGYNYTFLIFTTYCFGFVIFIIETIFKFVKCNVEYSANSYYNIRCVNVFFSIIQYEIVASSVFILKWHGWRWQFKIPKSDYGNCSVKVTKKKWSDSVCEKVENCLPMDKLLKPSKWMFE